MSWCEQELEKWSDFVCLVEDLTNKELKVKKEEGWYFRGQSAAKWQLKPSLLRLFPENEDNVERVIGIESQLKK